MTDVKQAFIHPLKLEIFEKKCEGKKSMAIRGDDVKKAIGLDLDFITTYRGIFGNPVFYGECPKRRDTGDLYIFHFGGKVHWKTEDGLDIYLTKGDVLYIPKGIAHEATPVTPQIAIAFRQTLVRTKNSS